MLASLQLQKQRKKAYGVEETNTSNQPSACLQERHVDCNKENVYQPKPVKRTLEFTGLRPLSMNTLEVTEQTRIDPLERVAPGISGLSPTKRIKQWLNDPCETISSSPKAGQVQVESQLKGNTPTSGLKSLKLADTTFQYEPPSASIHEKPNGKVIKSRGYLHIPEDFDSVEGSDFDPEKELHDMQSDDSSKWDKGEKKGSTKTRAKLSQKRLFGAGKKRANKPALKRTKHQAVNKNQVYKVLQELSDDDGSDLDMDNFLLKLKDKFGKKQSTPKPSKMQTSHR